MDDTGGIEEGGGGCYNDVCVRERGQLGGGSVVECAGISLHTKSQRCEVPEYYPSAGGDSTHYSKA